MKAREKLPRWLEAFRWFVGVYSAGLLGWIVLGMLGKVQFSGAAPWVGLDSALALGFGWFVWSRSRALRKYALIDPHA
ncbi:MAG: hypothetical protein ACYCPN_05615 [Thermoplasmata archaeon]